MLQKIQARVLNLSVGVGLLLLHLSLYSLFAYYGISAFFTPMISSVIEWLLWDPQVFVVRLQDIGLTLIAAAYAASQRDWQGLKQLFKASVTTAIITHLLKHVVRRTRPHGKGNLSFPSGHASSAFSAAAFIHDRYGAEKAIPAYIVASFVGCIRVHKLAHFPTDVIAGATLAILTAYEYVQRKPTVAENATAPMASPSSSVRLKIA